jgi:hypothetical protein
MSENKKPIPEDCVMDLTIPATNGRCNVKMVIDWSEEQDKATGNGFFLTDALYFDQIPNMEWARYLKGAYGTWDRLYSRFIVPRHYHENFLKPLADQWEKCWDDIKPYTYAEAFALTHEQYRALVFTSIDINDMIDNLGHDMLKKAEKPMVRKVWDENGNELPSVSYVNVYETHKVYGKNLNLNEDIYAVRCWCTTTEKSHWIWIESKYKDNPLEAIASTFFMHENVKKACKAIKRQGDILIIEMTEEVEPEGEPKPLTAEEYFGLLVAES